MGETGQLYRKTLEFFVNGIEIKDDCVDPEWTLLRYIRKKLKFTGTKDVCSEGGCGACTVMVSEYDSESKQIRHFTVNACLAPVCCMDGKAVTTVEALGSIETKLHPIQERLALAHGSQCGFCTPGFVMSMYTILRNNPTPSMKEIEDNLIGNLCRCTGYRPILEGFKTFAKSEDAQNQPCGRSDCCKLGAENSSSADNDLKSSSKFEKTSMLFDSANFKPLDASQDLIFPPDLLLKPKKELESLRICGPRMQFFRPTTLQHLLELKRTFPAARLVGGNTEIGVEVKYKNEFYPHLIDVSSVSELLRIVVDEEKIVIGSAVPLSTLEQRLKTLTETNSDGCAGQITAEILTMLKLFSGRQIRNVATLGGNIMTGSPISDLNPILMAGRCELCFKSLDGDRKVTMDEHFYTGYRQNVSKADEVLMAIEIPLTAKNEYFRAYKQARRRDDDIAIVNAAFRVRFEPASQVVADVHLVYGGMGPTTVTALQTMQMLKGKPWMDCLEEALSTLRDELNLDPSAPGGMVQYRMALAVSFFFKFHMETRDYLRRKGQSVPVASQASGLESLASFEIPNAQSMQFFQEVPPSQSQMDPIGRPIATASCFKQTTGEAIYTDDIPEYTDELHAAFILSTRAFAKIVSIDRQEALSLEGVHSVFTAKDISVDKNKICLIQFEDEELFARDQVNCVGQVVGVVVAEDPELARRAAKMVKIQYEDLPNPIITIKDAIAASSFFAEPLIIKKGDHEAAFESAYICFEGQFYIGGQEHFYLETNSHIAIPKDGDEMEIIGTTQCLELIQKVTAYVLSLPANKVVCKAKRIGGGFGGKETRTALLAAAISFAAKRVKKPVRLVMNRHEDMQAIGGRNPFLSTWKIGLEKTGRIIGLKANLYSNAGLSTDLSLPVLQRAMTSIDNAYRIENMEVVGHCCKTNLPSNTAFRGFGSPQGMAIIEDIISKAADRLKMDPNEVREINFYRSNGDLTHIGVPLEDCTIRRCWEEVLLSSNFEERRRAILEFNKRSIFLYTYMGTRGVLPVPI